MVPFYQCPICGGEMKKKKVEKILRGGNHTAVLKVSADVCLHCGERLYSPRTIKLFEEIRRKLANQEVSEFKILGKSFQIQPS
ncbi:YgiT-type zinc finger protein [bacterium]|nr:YgiT-type zinc finger protein [bacterium]